MPSETINMHGKIYDLLDEKIRVKKVAQTKAQEIRDNGQVAFLNPQKRKDKETNFWIYVAEKSVRRASSRKSISSKLLLEEYKKGSQSFSKFMKELEEAQKPAELVELAINELPKQTIKAEIKETSKKATAKKTAAKKAAAKKAAAKKAAAKKAAAEKANTKK